MTGKITKLQQEVLDAIEDGCQTHPAIGKRIGGTKKEELVWDKIWYRPTGRMVDKGNGSNRARGVCLKLLERDILTREKKSVTLPSGHELWWWEYSKNES